MIRSILSIVISFFPQCFVNIMQLLPLGSPPRRPIKGPLNVKSDWADPLVPHLPVVSEWCVRYAETPWPLAAGWRLEITGRGPTSCSHLSFFHLPICHPHPTPPLLSFSLCNVSAVPCRQGSLTECLLCYGFIELVCSRNLWIKVISHCSTFSQAVKLPFTFVPLGERDREQHM